MTVSTITLTAEQVRRLIVHHAPSSTAFATMMKMAIIRCADEGAEHVPWLSHAVCTLEEWMINNVTNVRNADITDDVGGSLQLVFGDDVEAVEFALKFANLLGAVRK